MNKFELSNMMLTKVKYNFTKPDVELISVSINDKINVLNISENKALLDVSRELSFGPETNSYVSVNYEVIIESDELITKESLNKAIEENKLGLVSVYAKMSLLISQITNCSPFGIIVTPPNYRIK